MKKWAMSISTSGLEIRFGRILTTVCLISLLLQVFLPGSASGAEKFTAAPDKDGKQRVEITGGEYFFSPNHIIVRVNRPVLVTIRKEKGLVPHNFIINDPETGLDIKFDLGSEGNSVEFTPARTGIFPFYCDKKLLFFKSHQEKGMEGVFEVVE